MEKLMARFGRVLGRYGIDRKRWALRVWFRNAMDFVGSHYKKMNMIEHNVSKKRKMFYYFKWRQAFLQKKHKLGRNGEGLKKVGDLL